MPGIDRRAALFSATLTLGGCTSVTPAPVQMALCPPPQPRADLLGDGTAERRVFIPSRWGQMHAYVRGGTDFKAKPALLLLHMMPFSGAFYRPLMAELAKDRLVVAPDLPGCGLSDGPHEAAPMATYADALLELINLTRIARVDVLGFHTGAALAAALSAHAEGPTVRRLVLAGYPHFEGEEARMRRAQAKPLELSTPELVAARWRALDAFMTGYNAERKRELIAQSIGASANVHFPTLAVLDQDTIDIGARVRDSVLMLVLDEMLAMHTRRAAQHFPTAKLEERPAWKSDAFENKASEIASRVRAFLDTA
jgi:pimeloyl-ACP methyl ester carboxylesterase